MSRLPSFRRGGGLAPPLDEDRERPTYPTWPEEQLESARAGAAALDAAFLAWLDAEIEAARQLQRSDPIATRTALERVKARLAG